MNASLRSILGAGAVALALVATGGAHAADEVSGTLEIRAALVLADLSVKPVPKHRMRLRSDPPAGTEIVATTGFDGTATANLPAGRYRLTSAEPLAFEGAQYSWDVPFVVTANGTTTVELSNDNATIRTAPASTSEGEIYERFKAGVFKILSDGGHGSGFLVSADGLVLTNYHVVADSTYLAAKIDERHKFAAVVLVSDETADLAVLRLHPDAVRGLPVIRLADDAADRPAVSVGDRVVAIGSPLSTETVLTSGLVSKVEERALYSDVNINPGNSGGPLFGARGEAVGVNTFGLHAERGAGLSGISRIYLAAPLLAEAAAKAATAAPPDAGPLPVEAAWSFPPDVLKAMALAETRKIDDYHIEAGKLDVHVVTPALFASIVIESERQALQGRKKRKDRQRHGQDVEESYEPGEAFLSWQRDPDNLRPVVRVRVFPEVTLAKGLAGALIGRGKVRFKTDFERMDLTRDGRVVEPIHPGRIKEVVSNPGFKDVGYWGYYEYAPEAFAPGADIALTIREQDVAEATTVTVPAAILVRVRADLAPYFDAAATAPDAPTR